MGALTSMLKRGLTETAPKRTNKFMGMVEEVQPLRLAKKEEEAAKKSNAGKVAAGAAALTAAGAAAMAGRDKKEEESTLEIKGRKVDSKTLLPVKEAKAETKAKEEEKPVKVAGKEVAKAPVSGSVSDFGKSFKEARAAGLTSFTFNDKSYTTRYAEESSSEHKDAIAKIKEKNDAAFEKVIQEKQNMKMAKGGAVKKNKSSHPFNAVYMGKEVKKGKK